MVTTRRGGVLQEIDGSELLVGDIIFLAPGDIIVADVQVRLSKDAFVDESMRTGETFPITVKNDALLYAGSSVVSGTITAQVTQAYQQSSLMQYAHRVDTVKKNNDFSIFLGRVGFDVCRRYFAWRLSEGFVPLVSCLFIHGILALQVSMLSVLFRIAVLIVTLFYAAALQLTRKVIVKHLPSCRC
jgi:Mg2+-importing ATPase